MIKEVYFKYRIFIIPAVVGFICLAIIGFVIVPQMIGFFKEKEKASTVLNRVDLLNKKAAELEKLDETKLQQDLITALTVLPTGRDVPQAMAVLQDLVAKSNLVLETTSYASTVALKGKEQNSFLFSISVSGSLASTRIFLNSLKESARLFKIESITLKFQPENGSVIADIPLSVYFQPAPSAALVIDQPIAKIGDKEEALLQNLSKFVFQPQAESTSSSVPLGKIDLFQ